MALADRTVEKPQVLIVEALASLREVNNMRVHAALNRAVHDAAHKYRLAGPSPRNAHNLAGARRQVDLEASACIAPGVIVLFEHGELVIRHRGMFYHMTYISGVHSDLGWA